MLIYLTLENEIMGLGQIMNWYHEQYFQVIFHFEVRSLTYDRIECNL